MMHIDHYFAIVVSIVLCATPARSFIPPSRDSGRALTPMFAKKPMKAQPRDPYANKGGRVREKDPKQKKTESFASPTKGFGGMKKKGPVSFEGTPIEDEGVAEFFDYLNANGADTSKVALADFDGLRGVMAIQDIAPGEAIITVPYELALDLGSESSDPTAPAVAFLDHYLNGASPARPYLSQIPAADSSDCTTTDFFSEEELVLLQCPQVVRATANRATSLKERYDALSSSSTPANQQQVPSLDALRWATWVIVSRVLTVQGREANMQRKCLIPLIDMVNHHPTKGAAQVLSGRAAPGSFMKILAGPKGVAAGSQVFIQYGGGVMGSARFLQDYGFVESATFSKARQEADLGFVAHLLSDGDRSSLSATTLEHDRALLKGESGTPLSIRAQLAVQFRIFLKEALEALNTPATNSQKPVSMGNILGD